MEPVREPPWAEHEKVYLLAEILKAAPISSQVLLSLIHEYHIQPRWDEIPLPQGRSLRSCQAAYNDLHATPDYRQRPQLPAPIVYPSSDMSKKRPLQPETNTPIGRLIQPRPPQQYSGEFAGGPAYPAMSSVGEPANKKKRGRPTKAEAQARADAAAARGEVYPPPRKARTSLTTTETSLGDVRMLGDTPPGPTPLAPVASTTPQMSHIERGSESSSKRKRLIPSPLELDNPHRISRDTESPLPFGPGTGEPHRGHTYTTTHTPISGPLPQSTEPRDRDSRMEGVDEVQPRTTTPHSFKDTVGI